MFLILWFAELVKIKKPSYQWGFRVYKKYTDISLDKSGYQVNIFLTSTLKHMLWLLINICSGYALITKISLFKYTENFTTNK